MRSQAFGRSRGLLYHTRHPKCASYLKLPVGILFKLIIASQNINMRTIGCLDVTVVCAFILRVTRLQEDGGNIKDMNE